MQPTNSPKYLLSRLFGWRISSRGAEKSVEDLRFYFPSALEPFTIGKNLTTHHESENDLMHPSRRRCQQRSTSRQRSLKEIDGEPAVLLPRPTLCNSSGRSPFQAEITVATATSVSPRSLRHSRDRSNVIRSIGFSVDSRPLSPKRQLREIEQ